jgi:hypothetical protein
VYDISDVPNPIADMFVNVLDTYTISDEPNAKFLKESLSEDWDIFNVGVETIQSLVDKLCISTGYCDNSLFTKKVIIDASSCYDTYCIVRGGSWKDFSNSIKETNRFHNVMFNSDSFEKILESVGKIYPLDTCFFRARIASDKNGFDLSEMGAPPKGKRSAGRINPEGISVLYLSSDSETVLREVRATVFDYGTIGEFKLKKHIKVANLSAISSTSPFRYVDIERYAANREVFKEISAEIAKPLRRNDSPLEYLPTQYIAEFIKSKGFDGVEYASTLKEGGFNIAVFDEKIFDCINVKTVEVSEISYVTKE